MGTYQLSTAIPLPQPFTHFLPPQTASASWSEHPLAETTEQVLAWSL